MKTLNSIAEKSVLNLALVIIFLFANLYRWAVNKRAEISGVIDKKEVEFTEMLVFEHLRSIFNKEYEWRLTRVHKGKVRYDAIVLTTPNRHQYVLRFIRSYPGNGKYHEPEIIEREIPIEVSPVDLRA